MPDYTYVCPACGAERHVTHSIRDEPVIACDACADAPRLVRALGGALFAVKGGRVASSVERHREAKDAREVADAKDLVRDVAAAYRPTLRAAAEGKITPPPKTTD